MHYFNSRVGRWSLAFTIAALGACTEDPAAPNVPLITKPNAMVADPFTVANTNDDGIGSLRWVLRYATGGETIRFDSTLAGQTITLDSTLMIRKPVTIEGPARTGITVSGGGKVRVIGVVTAGAVTLRNLTVTGGSTGTVVSPAIRSDGDLVIENSVVYGNSGGAGTVIYGGSITLINSTVSENTTPNYSEYYAAVMGGKVVVINSTIANNSTSGVGVAFSNITLRNSIVSNNAARNCLLVQGASITWEGANISDDDTCGTPTQIMIGDPVLGPLADNGGPTKTHALLAGSPAVNAGANCSVTVDQRYVPRDGQCDLGAFEFTTPTTVTLTIDPGVGVNQGNGWAVVTGTVKCSRNETFSVAVQLAQQQKNGRDVSTVDAAAIVPVECTTSVRPWIASMVLTSGAFTPGSAEANAQTVYTPGWVKPASATAKVKMYWARRSG